MRFRRSSGGQVRPSDASPTDEVRVLLSPAVAFVSNEQAAQGIRNLDDLTNVVIVDGDLSDPAVQRATLDDYLN